MALSIATTSLTRNSGRLFPLIAAAHASSSSSITTRSFSSSLVRPASTATPDVLGSGAKYAMPDRRELNSAIAPSQTMTEDWTIKNDYPDYSKGPSALDKASKLFFFNEILRGMWVV